MFPRKRRFGSIFMHTFNICVRSIVNQWIKCNSDQSLDPPNPTKNKSNNQLFNAKKIQFKNAKNEPKTSKNGKPAKTKNATSQKQVVVTQTQSWKHGVQHHTRLIVQLLFHASTGTGNFFTFTTTGRVSSRFDQSNYSTFTFQSWAVTKDAWCK